jgi:hypothetical protein
MAASQQGSPATGAAARAPEGRPAALPPELQWTTHSQVAEGSAAWTYLTRERALTPTIVAAATQADVLREGPQGSAWFAHRDGDGRTTGIEMRGPSYRGFSAGGSKSLFRLQLGREAPTRLAVTKAPIDAMSLAVLEGMRKDTLYVAAAGMGPVTIAALEQELTEMARRPGTVLVAATGSDPAGHGYAARLAELGAAAKMAVLRAVPAGSSKDWNDALKAQAGAAPRSARRRSSPVITTIVKAMQRPRSATPPPWAPVPVAMASRVQALETQDALRAATAMARRRPETGRPDEPGTPPSASPGARP